MENQDQQEPGSGSGSGSVMCQLVSPEGDHLGAALYLPQNVGPPQLQEIVNHLLHNVCTLVFFTLLLLPCRPEG
jgi:ribosome assembly protein 4